VLVPEKRKVPAAHRRGIVLHRGDLAPDQRLGPATSHEVTLAHCLRTLPFDEALTVADSALRDGVPASALRRVAEAASGPGAPRIRRVCRLASPDAANPFESVLRAIALEVGLHVVPQLLVAPGVRPDLVDPDLRIVLEADSFAWHGSRVALRRDARRYDLLVVDGWLVLRFAWEDVMHDASFVRSTLVAALALAQRRGEVTSPGRGAA
jgi:very-short-patch-repair endonuclease